MKIIYLLGIYFIILNKILQRNIPNQSIYFFLEWVGDLDSDSGGRLGLWKVCEKSELNDSCIGRLEDILQLPSMPFQVATIFAGLAVCTAVLTIFCLVFMIFMKTTTVFHICGWVQILSGKYSNA